MSFSVYDVTVPVMVHGLNVFDDYLGHAKRFEGSSGSREGRALEARLSPDMLTLAEQVGVACNKVDAHMAKLMGRDVPPPRPVGRTYDELRARLSETRAFLGGLLPGDLAGAETRTYELTPIIMRGWFGAQDYVLLLVMPDFFFHLATAHGILRHLGVRVGKRDYLGRLSFESGGYS